MQNKILLDVEIFRVNKINMTQNKQKKSHLNFSQDEELEQTFINPFLPNSPFWSSWKHQITKVFLCFQGDQKGRLGRRIKITSVIYDLFSNLR